MAQRKKRGNQVIRDAVSLIALFGDRAYSEVLAALARARHEVENGADPSHWFAVRREIARRVGKEIGLDTATRYLAVDARLTLASAHAVGMPFTPYRKRPQPL